MKWKLLVFGILVLSICSIVFFQSNLGAYPTNASPCSDCHAADPAVTLSTNQACLNGGSSVMYHVDISGPYGGQTGWGLYRQDLNSWSGAYGGANFTLPVGTTAQFWGVQGAINGTASGSSTEILTAACTLCADNDNDGYAVCTGQCILPPGKQCGDCDDNNPAVHPGAVEGPYGSPTCSDGLDNNCNGLTDAQDPACAPPPSTDYNISSFTCSSKINVGKIINLKVVVKNQLTTDYGATMTVYGNQGAANGGGAYIPIATNTPVNDPSGLGTAYTFTYTPTARGTITWTATVNDTNPDIDQANCTTTVR